MVQVFDPLYGSRRRSVLAGAQLEQLFSCVSQVRRPRLNRLGGGGGAAGRPGGRQPFLYRPGARAHVTFWLRC